MRKRAARYSEQEVPAAKEEIIKIDDEIEVIITTPAVYTTKYAPCKSSFRRSQHKDDDEVIVLSHRRPRMKSSPKPSPSKEELKITYNPKVIKLECPLKPVGNQGSSPFGTFGGGGSSCMDGGKPHIKPYYLPPPLLSPKVEPMDILEAETAPLTRVLASNQDSKTPNLSDTSCVNSTASCSSFLSTPRTIKVEPPDQPRKLRSRRKYKKKNEKELLYEALHEIKWAQHYTPAYILAKRNKRRPLKKVLNYSKLAKGRGDVVEVKKEKEETEKEQKKKKQDLKAKISLAKKIKESKKYNTKEKNRAALLKTVIQKKKNAQDTKLTSVKTLGATKPPKPLKEATDGGHPIKNKPPEKNAVVKIKPQLNVNLSKKLPLQEKKPLQSLPTTTVLNTQKVPYPNWKCELKDKLANKTSKLETSIQGDKMVWKTEPLKTKKKKPEEEFSESLRMSVRQSECAFRYKDIAVRKHQNYIQIVLVPNTTRFNSLTLDGMKELREALHTALKDPGCRAVLLNSSGSIFCSGLDLNTLVSANRKKAALEMALALKELVQVLSRFPKPLVAAVNGATVGFGVTLLTYCDVVLASDKATFSMPYGRLGHIPEGAATLTLPPVVGTALASAMLLRDVRLSAQQALRHGLVSEVLWPSSLMEEVLPRVLKLANQPLQVMETTKIMVRWHLWDKFQSTLDYEVSLLPQQWLSPLCQQAMRQALARHMYLMD